MQANRLIVKDIGIIQNIDIKIDKPLIIFYGEIKQGKSTILDAIKLLFGGGYSKDLIRHGQKTAFVRLDIDGGYIKREWYINKKNEIIAKPLEFVKNGELVTGRRIDEVMKYSNPFLLDQNYFKKMNKIEKAKFLLDIFNVDITDIDKKREIIEAEAKDLRYTIKAYGKIDLTEFKKPDIEKLKAEKVIIDEKNKIAETINENRNKAICKMQDNQSLIEDMELKIKSATQNILDCENWLSDNSEQIIKFTTDIDEKISDAKVDNLKYEQYQKNLCLQYDKDADNLMLSQKEQKLRDLKKESAKRLQPISDQIKGLKFKEDGDFIYLDTASDMLSDSMQAELSSKLSALYPEGLQLELIDQGESWGKSIFTLIDHAVNHKRNILVTKVGDKDAEISKQVGVFVIENGTLKKD